MAVVLLTLLLLADSFLDWLGQDASVGPVDVSETWNAWHFGLSTIAVVVGVLALVPAVLRLCGIHASSVVITVLGGLAFALVLAKVLIGPHIDTGGFDVTIEETREIGIYLGRALSAGIAGVGVLELIHDKKGSTP